MTPDRIKQIAGAAGIELLGDQVFLGSDFGGLNADKIARFAELVQADTLLSADFYKLVRAGALGEAEAACQAERLEEPQNESDDIAYEMAIADCIAAIRALAQ